MQKNKILVVDDEHLIRWSLEQNLKKQGWQIAATSLSTEHHLGQHCSLQGRPKLTHSFAPGAM